MDSHLPKLEGRTQGTPPIWEQVLNKIVEMRRDLCKRLDRIEPILRETRAGLRDVEDRVEKIERKPVR